MRAIRGFRRRDLEVKFSGKALAKWVGQIGSDFKHSTRFIRGLGKTP